MNVDKLKVVGSGTQGTIVELECSYCGENFQRLRNQIKHKLATSGKNYKPYCSKKCQIAGQKQPETWKSVTCETCGKTFEKKASKVSGKTHNFCSHSCSSIFNNKERKKNGFSQKGQQKEAQCIDCDAYITISAFASEAEARCNVCWKQCYNSTGAKYLNLECIECGTQIISAYKRTKYCAPL